MATNIPCHFIAKVLKINDKKNLESSQKNNYLNDWISHLSIIYFQETEQP